MSYEVRCPHCRLALRISQGAGGPLLDYDVEEWKRRCKHLDLNSPAHCLAERKPKTLDRPAQPDDADFSVVTSGEGWVPRPC
jgi:hypothetical protein